MAAATGWSAQGGPPPKGDWLLAFRDAVPEPLRFWILLSFAIAFQFTGGIHLALASQMVGASDMIRQDTTMAGYATFVGMTMVFPLLFPLKFRFPVRGILLACALGLAFCGAVASQARSLLVLVPVCFASGMLRMLGTFTCCSTVQLRITPERNMGKFFPVLWAIILGGIQLSGIVAVGMEHRFGWQSMHHLAISVLLVIAVVCFACMTSHRPPFHGPREIRTDPVGFLLWTAFLLLAAWVPTYGEHLGWTASPRVGAAFLCLLVALGLSLWRARRVERSYLVVSVLRYPGVLRALVLHSSMVLLMASTYVLQETFTGGVLHLGHRDSQQLNWVVFAGVLVGAVLGYMLLEKAKLGYRVVITFSFLLMLGYLVGMQRLISPATARSDLILPLFARGVGNIMMYVALFTWNARSVPFFHLFHVVGFYGFVNMGFGGAVGSAVVERLFAISLHGNAAMLGASLDRQNPVAASMSFDAVASEFHRQVVLVSLRQTYGWMALLCLLVVFASLLSRYRNFPRFKLPNW